VYFEIAEASTDREVTLDRVDTPEQQHAMLQAGAVEGASGFRIGLE
jgi:hypothetical protein